MKTRRLIGAILPPNWLLHMLLQLLSSSLSPLLIPGLTRNPVGGGGAAQKGYVLRRLEKRRNPETKPEAAMKTRRLIGAVLPPDWLLHMLLQLLSSSLSPLLISGLTRNPVGGGGAAQRGYVLRRLKKRRNPETKPEAAMKTRRLIGAILPPDWLLHMLLQLLSSSLSPLLIPGLTRNPVGSGGAAQKGSVLRRLKKRRNPETKPEAGMKTRRLIGAILPPNWLLHMLLQLLSSSLSPLLIPGLTRNPAGGGGAAQKGYVLRRLKKRRNPETKPEAGMKTRRLIGAILPPDWLLHMLLQLLSSSLSPLLIPGLTRNPAGGGGAAQKGSVLRRLKKRRNPETKPEAAMKTRRLIGAILPPDWLLHMLLQLLSSSLPPSSFRA